MPSLSPTARPQAAQRRHMRRATASVLQGACALRPAQAGAVLGLAAAPLCPDGDRGGRTAAAVQLRRYRSTVTYDGSGAKVVEGASKDGSPRRRPPTIKEVAEMDFDERTRCEGGTIAGNGELAARTDAADAADPMVVPYWHRHSGIVPSPALRMLEDGSDCLFEDRPRAFAMQAPHIEAYFGTVDIVQQAHDSAAAGGAGGAPCVLDCGANVGYFTIEFLRRYAQRGFGGAQPSVMCVEPVPATCCALQLNLERYPVEVRPGVLQCGVGARGGFAPFTTRRGSSVTATCHAEDAVQRPGDDKGFTSQPLEVVKCEVRTLDAILRDHSLHRVDLLKLDVEGAELAALQALSGAGFETIQSVAVEVHTGRDPARLGEVVGLLEQHGLQHVTVQHSVSEDVPLSLVFASRRQWASPQP